jgi:hypothetical protein
MADVVSVDHPGVVNNYRNAHAVDRSGGQVTTEGPRKAMVHYRSLFDELLGNASLSETSPERKESRA